MRLMASPLALVCTLIVFPGLSGAQSRQVPGLRQMQRHNPSSRHYEDLLPAHRSRGRSYSSHHAHARTGNFHHGPGHHFHGRHHRRYHDHGLYGYGLDFYYPGYYGGSYLYSLRPIVAHYPYGYPGSGLSSIYGPLILPQNNVFGPAAVPNAPAGLQGNLPAAVPVDPLGNGAFDPADNAPNDDAEEDAFDPPRSSPPARRRAAKFLGMGDDLFAKQQYSLAYQRYQDAVAQAPDLPEIQIRRGFALAVMKKYERAVKAFQRALELDADWPQTADFELDDLYRQNKIAKTAVLDMLAAAAEREPFNGDLMFLIGVHLWFDGQAERSQLFFKQASRMLPSELIGAFTDPPEAEKPRRGVEF